MRTIKFRGKRIDNGEWVYGNLIYDNISDKYWIDLSINENEKIDGGLHIYAVEVDPETIGQYTGLKDKSGKEIYEGDIIQYEKIYKGVVVYSEEYAQFVLKETGNIADECEALGEFYMKVFEICSNIHDNPKLLEVQDD